MTQSGWHFLQIPGPTNVPDRVLRAMARPTIDHRGPEFAALTLELIGGLQRVFKTTGAGRHLSGLGLGRVRSRLRQHAVAGRSRPRLRDRPLLAAVEVDRRAAWPPRGLRAGQLAPRRVGGGARIAVDRRHGSRDQGRRRRPQRDVNGRREPDSRSPEGDGSREAIRRC